MSQEINPTIPPEATEILNREAANYGDEATYEYVRCVEIVASDYVVLAFNQIVNGVVVKTVNLDFIIDKDGNVRAN